MKNIEQFLKKIGVENKIVSALASAEEDGVNVDDFASAYKEQIKAAISSDPTFIEGIKKEVNGEVLSKVEHKIKKTFNLDPTEINGKKFDEIVAIAHQKATTAVQSTGDEWQTKYMELSKEHKKLVEDVLPAKEAEKNQFIKSYTLNEIQMKKLAEKKLAVKPKLAMSGIQDALKEMKIVLDVNEDGEVVAKTKDGLNVLSKDGTKVMNYDEILDEILGPNHLNIIQQSNGQPSGATIPKGVILEKNVDSGKFNLPGLAAAKENAERMKNIRTFGQ